MLVELRLTVSYVTPPDSALCHLPELGLYVHSAPLPMLKLRFEVAPSIDVPTRPVLLSSKFSAFGANSSLRCVKLSTPKLPSSLISCCLSPLFHRSYEPLTPVIRRH